ncbi:hypothetical protein EYF80_014958 [Liparis tanakae]|uniref:Uncharacterized protein n=1 Tax=Liparis tanakae TaxID=230148 RepID=A0A4Z2IA50_9TELE|nr:hypothetical protein EYF80_014958 [Liparis tanakae]
MQALAYDWIKSIAHKTTKVFTCSQEADGTLPNVPDVTEAKPLGGKRFGYETTKVFTCSQGAEGTLRNHGPVRAGQPGGLSVIMQVVRDSMIRERENLPSLDRPTWRRCCGGKTEPLHAE